MPTLGVNSLYNYYTYLCLLKAIGTCAGLPRGDSVEVEIESKIIVRKHNSAAMHNIIIPPSAASCTRAIIYDAIAARDMQRKHCLDSPF